MRAALSILGSARALACWFRRPRRNNPSWPELWWKQSSRWRGAIASTRGACAPLSLAFALCLTTAAGAATLQQQIDAAAPNETIHVESGIHVGPIVINKPLTLAGEADAEIRGNGVGKVITIAADNITVTGLRITGSGLNLSDDDAAIFVTGNRATIERNTIANSLHGIYLKKVSGARILENRIEGKTTIAASTEPIEKGIGQSAENCDTTLVANRRGNGIHQWNCEENLIRGNEISEARDGIYFSFTNNSRVENNRVHHVRYGLHYMYSDNNVFENNTFTENAAGAAIMFSKELLVRGNRFVSNRGFRAYGLIVQSTDRSRFESNEIEQNAVGLSFNQCIGNRITGNTVRDNYIGLKFGSNSDANQFSENVFTRNLHPVETGLAEGDGNKWAVKGVGNFWGDGAEIDLNRDGIGDLPHREIDLFGILRRDFPAVAFLSGSPAVKLLGYANERAAVPGVSSIDDPAPLTAQFWKVRAQRLAQTAAPNEQ
ncbi:MAG TPA: NosD domain-containing protein [Chthoniobacterales bacterium]|nr:NosD domain-containing protein [Chthoniobacterales bacterium]